MTLNALNRSDPRICVYFNEQTMRSDHLIQVRSGWFPETTKKRGDGAYEVTYNYKENFKVRK